MDIATKNALVSSSRLALAQDFTFEAIGPIRRIVQIQLGLWGMQDLADRCALVVSELCSNIRHTGNQRFELQAGLITDGVRLEIRDYSTVLPAIPDTEPDGDAVSGRGLYLVACNATRVAMDRLDDGKIIWAELMRSSGERHLIAPAYRAISTSATR